MASFGRALDLERICSFRYEATVGNDNTVRLAGMILDIPAGSRRRGYAKTRVEVRQLLGGRWRVYYKDQLYDQRSNQTARGGDIFADQLRWHNR